MRMGVFLESLTLALPVALFSYLVIGYILAHGFIESFDDAKALKESLKQAKANHKKASKKNYLLKKWFQFGGGFYGLVAVYTYAWIEFWEMIGLIVKFSDPDNWTFNITINLLVGFVINAIKNLVYAAIWFSYWPETANPFEVLVWVAAAYIAYRGAVIFARDHYKTGRGHMSLWQKSEKQTGQK